MLADTAMENGEIAFYLDFNEANSFHRFFIGQTGKTPNEWRAEKRCTLCRTRADLYCGHGERAADDFVVKKAHRLAGIALGEDVEQR